MKDLSKIRLLKPLRIEPYQFFREWFGDACMRAGAKSHFDLRMPWGVRLLIGKLGLCFSIFKRTRLLVLSGGRPEYFAWPWCYFYEIVPVVWDCWPKYWPHIIRFVRKNRVRTIFCTSSQTADFIRKCCPEVDAVWLPEGIEVNSYPCGGKLADRKIDILEMGRVMKPVHDAITCHHYPFEVRHKYPQDGLLFRDFANLTRGMRESKISICYPRCDTNPEMAGELETMTQRYWEFMLSGTLIVGRAPRELVEFCGYNPVVELGDDPAGQIQDILSHIGDYQDLVNTNRKCAEMIGSWDARMPLIMEHLK